MKCTIALILSFLCFCLVSCSFVPNELQNAELVMETKPDSALHILQRIQPQNLKSDAHKALYGLMFFQALDKNNLPLQPDSLINFSLNYYQNQNDKNYLAKCYYYKARIRKSSQHFDDATILYLKALDLIQGSKENYLLLGKIYSDMGDICILQKDYDESLKKLQQSIAYFDKAGNAVEKSYRVISIGKIYRFQKNYKRAYQYYHLALSRTTDSLVCGSAYQEIGINYYWAKQYDSAQVYIRKSLKYTFKGTNYCIRCVNLADLMFNFEQFDSAAIYALLSLKYPGTFYNRRDCYRILANTEYNRGNLEQMGKYMSLYQASTDSVRKIEIQTKSTVLEKFHDKEQETAGTKRNMFWIVSVMVLVLLLALLVLYVLYQRYKLRKSQLAVYKQELSHKQEFVNQNLSNKLKETRQQQAAKRKNATSEERMLLDKELYEKCLHLSNWDVFSCEMNHAFNQIVETLQNDFSGITQKEISWCCFHLLDIPQADRLLLLDATTDSLYKLKQRLAQKMHLKSTKELDLELKRMSCL